MATLRRLGFAMVFMPAALYAQGPPSLDLNAPVVAPSASIRVTISGQPGDH